MSGHVLDQVEETLERFVAYPSEATRVAHTLWIAHTHLMDVWESTPRIAFLSPEPGSGKTRALEITEMLVPRPILSVNVTPSYLFRKVSDEDGAPTLLYDEIDTVFGPKARENEDIRALLNSGHRRGAMVGRSVVRGKTVTTEELPAYCALALAGIGELPDTILTRSIVVRMRRRKPGEHVTPYRRRVHGPDGDKLHIRLAEWCEDIADKVDNVWPDIPDGIEDRDADLWEPLLTIADAAGGTWPERARVSAVTLVTEAKGSTPSLGIRLLADVRDLFGESDHMFTSDLVRELNNLEEAPWGDLYGRELNARGLAQRLRKYDISSKTVRVGEDTAKGYAREDLWDAWDRYLPPIVTDKKLAKASSYSIPSGDEDQPVDTSSHENVTSVTKVTACHECGLSSGRHGYACRHRELTPQEIAT